LNFSDSNSLTDNKYQDKTFIKASLLFLKGRSPFWPNYSQILVLAIELENQKSSTIKLLKPFPIDHLMILEGGFTDVAAK
jgi:hypothetical protein